MSSTVIYTCTLYKVRQCVIPKSKPRVAISAQKQCTCKVKSRGICLADAEDLCCVQKRHMNKVQTRPLARSLGRSLAGSLCRSLARSLVARRSLGRSVARSLDRSLARSLARSLVLSPQSNRARRPNRTKNFKINWAINSNRGRLL